MLTVGIDACRTGWVAIVLQDGEVATAVIAKTLTAIVSDRPDAMAIGVDMPLGLVDQGWRQADRLAAARLGASRSRLFLVPPRAAWACGSYQAALAVCRELTNPPAGFSRQAWALKAKLWEANALYALGDHPVFEVHPEISFAELNGGTPVTASKKTWNGQMIRRALLADAGIRLPSDLANAGNAAPDDILDAAAAAWTATRIASHQATSLPQPPETGSDGRPVAIWY